MPQANRFRHQAYTSTPPISPHYLVSPGTYPPVGSSEFRRRMHQVGASFGAAGVAAIYFVDGSLPGAHALRVLAKLARVFPSARWAVRRLIKQTINQPAGEFGSYTDGYARLFEDAIHRPGARRIPVRLFEWSGENHHIGRADGAVRLINELAWLEPDSGGTGVTPVARRVLLWGHGHAGNLFALMTNLLAGNRDAVERFFAAAEIYYRWPMVGCVDIPVWHRVRKLLNRQPWLLADVCLDIVTFGTPIRYGWDSAGYCRLLHFINHRPAEGLPEYRAPFPPKIDDVMAAAEGDYVQQLGIAGTNVMPGIFAWRSRLAEGRLNRLLQTGPAQGGPLERFQAGTIVHDEGTTLLVDYGEPDGSISQHHAGHAVYTGKQWLLFHAEEIARRFYSAHVRKAA